MYIVFLLGVWCATGFATPVTQFFHVRSNTTLEWQPAEGTTTTCDEASDKIIGFYVGPQMESVLTDACVAMMPPCAHPERVAKDVVCAQVIDWRLDGPKSSKQSANIETAEGNKISGWDVQLSVIPAAQPENSAGVFWTAQDCYGYFAYMLEKWKPEGCHTTRGFGIGNITVGGQNSLAGTVFKVEIVTEK